MERWTEKTSSNGKDGATAGLFALTESIWPWANSVTAHS